MRALPLLLLLAGPLVGQEVVKPYRLGRSDLAIEEVDRITQTRRWMTHPTVISGSNIPLVGLTGVEISWAADVTRDADTSFAVALKYRHTEWAFIGGADQPIVEFLLNGTHRTVMPVGEPRRDVQRDRVQEVVIGEIPVSVLFEIARADSVFWRVNGERRKLEGDTRPSTFERLRRLLATMYPDSTIYSKK